MHIRKILLLVLLLGSCGLLPSAATSALAVKAPTTTQSLVDAAPAAVDAVSGLVETLIMTGLIASIVFRQVRLAVAAMLVAFYQRIESWFKPSVFK